MRKLDPDSDSHTVTAYIAGIRASLNQVFISKKSNEINAVKELLDVIDVEGNILTIDAIGTQKEIVDKIVSKKGEYILQVKSNQPGTLLELEVAKRPTASSVRIISPGLYWNLKSIFVPSTRMKLSQQRVWNRGMAEWKLANLRA